MDCTILDVFGERFQNQKNQHSWQMLRIEGFNSTELKGFVNLTFEFMLATPPKAGLPGTLIFLVLKPLS